MRRLIYLSLFILVLIPNSLWAQPTPTSPWIYSDKATAHTKPGVETVVIGGSSQGSLQLYDTTGLNKVTVLTESVLGADFIVTLPISGGGCDPSALSDGEILFVASAACTGNSGFFYDSASFAQTIQSPSSKINFLASDGTKRSELYGDGTSATTTIPGLKIRSDRYGVGYAAPPAGSTSFQVLAQANGTSIATLSAIMDNASDTLAGRWSFATNSTATPGGLTERLRIDSAANVSIGPGAASAAPMQFAYDDNGDGSNSPYIYLRNTAVGGYTGMSFIGHTVSDSFASIEANGNTKYAVVTLLADGTTGVNANSFQGSTGFRADRNSGSGGSVYMTIDGTGGTAGNAAILALAPPGGAVATITSQSGTGGATVEAYTDNNGIAKVSARTTSLTIAPLLNIIYGSGTGAVSTYALIHDPVGIITEYRSPNPHVFTFSGTETVRFATNGAVTMQQLKTTGAATGKKIVCVDTATGTLYASSSGVACAN